MKKLLFYSLLCLGICIGCESREEEIIGQKANSTSPLEKLDAFVYTETFDTIQIYENTPSVNGYAHKSGNYMCNLLDVKLERWAYAPEEATEMPTYVFYFLSPQHSGERFPEGIYSQNASVNKPWRINKAGRITYLDEYNTNYSHIILREELTSQCCMQIEHDGEKEYIKIWMEFIDSEPTYRYVEFTKKIDLTSNFVGTAFECDWWKHCIL